MAALLALVSSLWWGSADFLGGTLSRRRRATVVVGVSQSAGLLLALALAAAVGAFGDDRGYLPWALLSGVAGVVGLVCFYAALAAGTMGVVSPIAALGVVVPVVVGLAGGDRPDPAQLVGIVVAVVGVVLASGPELSGRAGARPVLLAGVAAVGFGVALLAIAKGSASSTYMTLVTMRATSVTLLGVALVIALARGLDRADVTIPPPELGLIALVGVGDLGANLTFGLASRRADIAVVAVLGSLYPVVTVLLARVFHHERLGRLQTAGVALALAGVALIAAG
ncbi:MAG: DMT family transporter [Sporichthyaceae bacterium]